MNQKLAALVLATVMIGAVATPAIPVALAAGNTGTLTGSVANSGGAAVGNAGVLVYNEADDVYSTGTDGNGDFSLAPTESNYTMIVSHPKYAEHVRSDVNVTAGETTDVSVTLEKGVTVSGTVTDGESGVGNVGVLFDDGNRFYGAFPSPEGTFSKELPPGEYNVMVYSQQNYVLKGGMTLDTAKDSTTGLTLNVVQPTVESSSVSVVEGGDGVDASSISVDASVQNGFMMVRLLNDKAETMPGMPNDLEPLGVTDDTVFEISMTMSDYDPNSLLWGARNVSWSTSQNDDGSVDVTVQTKAVHLAGIQDESLNVGPLMGKNPDEVTWPTGTNDKADLGWKQSVYFGFFDLSNMPAEKQDRLGGMTVTTNAQTFMLPRVDDDELRVWVGGPHQTMSGKTHDGFYEATIPDSQLDAWGVSTSDPASELQAKYKGSDKDATFTNLDDGVRLRIDLTYSSGSVSVSPSGGEGGGGDDPSGDPSPGGSPHAGGDGGGTGGGQYLSGSQSARASFSNAAVREARVNFDRSVNGRVSMQSIRALPADVPRPKGSVLSSVEITVPDSERDNPATVSLTIDRDAVDAAGTTPERLRVARLQRGASAPEILDTRVESATEDSVDLSADTPGFSVFVVVSTDTAQTPTATPVSGQSTPAPPQATPTATPEPATDTAPSTDTPTPERVPDDTSEEPAGPEATATPASSPGFGLVAAIVGLLSAIGLLRRRH